MKLKCDSIGMIKLYAVISRFLSLSLDVFYCVLNKNFESNIFAFLNIHLFMNTVRGSNGFALTHNSLQLSRGAHSLYSDGLQALKLLILKLPVCVFFRYNDALSHFHTLLN